ncbi:MAG TPA: hypothetical protein VJO53_13710 [Candidatus Acidoferrales bacterium]|nr:hypothetical protein [Candidatus Acidoferrales bacterium]
MNSLLMAFAKWLQGTGWALALSGSTWAYPFVQATHFSGLSLWLGTNLSLDLRLLGIGKKRQTASRLSDALFAWNWIGFGIAVLGGFMLFASSATKYIPNPAFRIKLGILVPLGILLHIVNQWKSRSWGQSPDTPAAAKLFGLIELLLWIAVVTAAVSIPSYDHR